MNDLRSPLEDRPYRPATPQYAPQNYQNGSSLGAKFQRLRQHRFFPLGSVLLAVIVFGGVISYAYNQGSQTGVNATTPVVQASNEDYKTKPENPGGMNVPFQDAVVFDQLQNNGQQAAATNGNKVESLLPSAEQPVATTAPAQASENTAANANATTAETTAAANTAPAAQTTTTQSEQSIANVLDQAANTSAATTNTAANNASAIASTTNAAQSAQTIDTEQAAEEPAATTAATITEKPAAKTAHKDVAAKMAAVAPAATAPAAKIQSGSYRIQLGSFHDQAAAHTAWNKLKAQFNSQLANVSPDFPRADLGAKGTFYRVQGVNLSKASADQICGQINAAKSGACIVTK